MNPDKIVVTEEMLRVGVFIWAEGFDANETKGETIAAIYRAMAALDPNRRAPSVTREEIAARLLAHDEESTEDWAVNYIKMGMNDADHSIMEEVANEYLARADAILALFGGDT